MHEKERPFFPLIKYDAHGQVKENVMPCSKVSGSKSVCERDFFYYLLEKTGRKGTRYYEIIISSTGNPLSCVQKLSLLKKENTHIDKCLSLSRIHKNHMHSHMSKSVFYRFQENFIVNTLKRKATKIRFWYYYCYDRLKTLKTLNRGSQFCSIRVIMCSKHSFYTIKRIYKYFWTHFTFFVKMNEWKS